MSRRKERKKRVVASAEKLFGQPVLDVEAPGGESRSIYRLKFKDRTVIGTLRPNFRRTHLEAFILREIRPHCTDLPECLGVDGDILYQSDVGGQRLNYHIYKAGKSTRVDLAYEAVRSILRIQSAGRAARLHEALPHLGQNRLWVENLVESVDLLKDFSQGRAAGIDRPALAEMIAFPGRQFVKWDCRSGNAAIGADDRLRWFDCEYAGVRHGAEDLAWLIGDEAWPLRPDVMEAIVTDCFDPECGHTLDDYLDYLALYLTFHCLQRFKLIMKEVNKRGWLSKTRVRKFDDVGVHPEFAAQLCLVGAYFADRNPQTRPIARDFEDAEMVFLNIIKNSLQRARA